MTQALENEMDLREYVQQIESEKKSVQRELENNCKDMPLMMMMI